MASQRDPRWADLKLGTSAVTIGNYGCLLTAAADMLAWLGAASLTPAQLNRWLVQHDGFVGGNLFVFTGIEPLDAYLVELIDCYHQAAPMERVDDALGYGYGVLALVDFNPGGTVQQHWVRITGRDRSDARIEGEYEIMDPWLPPGMEYTHLLARYGLPTWNAARAIYRLAIYRRSYGPEMSAALGAREEPGWWVQARPYARPGTPLIERLRARFA